MIFWYCDEDSGEPVQSLCRLAKALSAKKKESSNRFWMLFHCNIAVAALRHAEFPKVRQSQ